MTTPGELGVPELARWEHIRSAVPSLESPFLSAAFTTHVGEVRRDARVAVLRGGSEPSGPIVGFLPFHTSPTRLGRPIGRKLANAHGAVVDPSVPWDPRAVVRRCGLRALAFEHLVEGQPALSPYMTGTDLSPQIDLGDGFDAYLDTARRQGRGGPRAAAAQRRRMERDHDVRFTWNEGDPRALHTLLSWKSDQYRRTGAFDQTRRPWVVDLLERLHGSDDPTCEGVLTTLHVDDRLVALNFLLRSGTHLAGWFSAYDPASAKHSPGTVLLLDTARAAAQAGVRTLDLSKGSEGYKDRWATGGTRLSTATVVRGPAAGSLTAASRLTWGIARRAPFSARAGRLRWRLDGG